MEQRVISFEQDPQTEGLQREGLWYWCWPCGDEVTVVVRVLEAGGRTSFSRSCLLASDCALQGLSWS